jgi:tetratricopeptide (TPR) repeat protein
VVTAILQRLAEQVPRQVGEVGRVVVPAGLLLLYIAAFRVADAGGRGRESAAGNAERSAAAERNHGAVESAAECDGPPREVEALERCLLDQPDDLASMLDLGAAYERQRRWVDAERVYLRAVGLDPREGAAHLGLGRTYLARGQLSAARQEGEAALRTQPGNPEALALRSEALRAVEP